MTLVRSAAAAIRKGGPTIFSTISEMADAICMKALTLAGAGQSLMKAALAASNRIALVRLQCKSTIVDRVVEIGQLAAGLRRLQSSDISSHRMREKFRRGAFSQVAHG